MARQNLSLTVPPRPEEVIDNLVSILSKVDAEVVFCTAVGADGRIGDTECLASQDQPKNTIPLDALLGFAHEVRAPALMITSKSSGPMTEIADCDLDFTRRLLAAAWEQEIEIHDHILVGEGTHRSLKQVTELWH